MLGYLNPAHLVGGALTLNADKARAAFAEKIAEPLGLPLEQAAYGAHQIAASNMIRAIKAVSTERGRDPREFALFAFGGNGPLFAAGMAASLGMSRWSCRPRPACSRRSACSTPTSSTTIRAPSAGCCARPTSPRSSGAWDALARQASAQLAAEGFAARSARLRRSAALHYQGQSYELTVPVPDGADRCRAWSRISRRRSARSTSGPTAIAPAPDEPVELVSIQLVGQGLREGGGVPEQRAVEPRRSRAAHGLAPAYFGAEHGWLETPILRRADLATGRAGPLIVEEYDATCVVPPGASAELDARRQHRDRAVVDRRAASSPPSAAATARSAARSTGSAASAAW